ncbi:MAG: arylsulfotransferase family protein [Clostridia bacterium]
MNENTKKNKTLLTVCACVITGIICFILGGFILGSQATTETTDEETTIEETTVEETTQAAEEEDAIEYDALSLTVNGFDLEVSLENGTHTWFDVEQMSTLIPNTISLDETIEGYTVYIDGNEMSEGDEIEVELEYLSQASSIEIELVDNETDETICYNIRTLHSIYDAYTEGEGEGDGYYYFSQNGNIYKMDMSGNIVFYKDCNGTSGRDFKQVVTDDGTIYYTYVEAGENFTDEKANAQYTQSQAIIMDENYEVVDKVEFLNTSEGMPENHSIEGHEFIMIDLGHYFISAYVTMEVDNFPTEIMEDGTGTVVASVLQEVKDGELLFQWVSSDYEELYAYSTTNSGELTNYDVEGGSDYVHFNSIDFDENGDLICSFRRLSCVIKIDRETAEIVWILGGEGDDFGLTDEQKFSFQHLAYYSSENTITLFDNGPFISQTRAVEITIDEETMSVVDYNAYEIDGYYAPAQGSAIRLDDDEAIFLMGWGTWSGDGCRFSEVNFETGEVYFELFDLDDDTANGTYRVYKFDS